MRYIPFVFVVDRRYYETRSKPAKQLDLVWRAAALSLHPGLSLAR